MKLTGAQVVVQCLREQKVDTIFGYPGGTVINIYDVLYNTEDIRHILTAHEQGATHAADGYARATGKVGVLLVTSGPGAANTVTGIATAQKDSVPMVIICGQVARPFIGKDSFQELDITTITKSITKKNFRVDKPEELADILREAFRIAQSGRPGPVLVDIPKDIQQIEMEYEDLKVGVNIEINNPIFCDKTSFEILERNIERAVEEINNSKRPVIYVGGGVKISNAYKELFEFVHKIQAPVACSFMGIGVYPGTHPNHMGMLGMHGTRCANLAVSSCDLIIALGVRFSDRATCKTDEFAPYANIIHIDIDPNELGKNVATKLSLCGDVSKILNNICEKVEERQPGPWIKQIHKWKKQYVDTYKSKGSLNPQYLLTKLHELTQGNSIITTEVGQNQMWTAQYYPFNDPKTFISSGGLGTMGFGLGAAIGSAFGRPDKKIINIAGDGSFKMNLNELDTVARYNLPIIQLVMNNGTLGMVRQWQKIFCNQRYSHTTIDSGLDFVKIAEAFNIKGMRMHTNEDVEPVLKKALEMNKPVVIDCIIHSDDLVLPMVPANQPLDQFIETC